MKNHTILILFYVFVLVGCGSISTLPAAPVPPTKTLPPTVTLTGRAETPTLTSTATPSPDFSETEFAITSTALVQAVMTAQQPREYGSYTSPDGNWQARVVIYDCIKVDPGVDAGSNALEQLKILEVSSEKEHVADSQFQYCGGLGAFGLEGLFWSPNSRYFYYTNGREGFPDGCPGNWERPVLRVETDTFEVKDLGRGPLSPDGTRLAAWQGDELVIWDINESVETARLSPAIQNPEMGAGGPILWSPDNQALIYIQSGSYCQPSTKSSLVHLDLQTLEQEILLDSQSPPFVSAKWETIDKLTLFDENQIQWVYNFTSRELEPSP